MRNLKFILIVGLSLACASTTFAKKSTPAPKQPEPVKLNNSMDSLSYYLGKANGIMYHKNIKESADSAKFKSSEFLKGLGTIMETDTANTSFMKGIEVGLGIKKLQEDFKKQFGSELNPKVAISAFSEALVGDIAPEVASASQDSVQKMIKKLMDQKVAKYEQEGKDYVDKLMKADSAYKITPSGLVYKVIKAGTGVLFNPTDRILVDYTGSLLDGRIFDSSNGHPRTFSPNDVVPGFKEALTKMSPGAQYEVIIPSKLAYGSQGQPQAGINPGEAIKFNISTLGLETDPSQKETQSTEVQTKSASQTKTATSSKTTQTKTSTSSSKAKTK